MQCYRCRNYDACQLDWKCSADMYDCSAYELEQTNEEWMKSVSVREAIGYFCYKALGSDGCKACRLNTKEKCRLNEWLKEKHVEVRE